MTDTTAREFSADTVRSYLSQKRRELEQEKQAHDAEVKVEREKLRAAFMEREIQPEALTRVEKLIWRTVDAGEKEVLVFRFPSDWLPDKGRSITNQDANWHQHLDGFAKRAFEFYKRELEPRGFQIRAQVLDWPGGMPGDVGFFLNWKHMEGV